MICSIVRYYIRIKLVLSTLDRKEATRRERENASTGTAKHFSEVMRFTVDLTRVVFISNICCS